MHYAESEHSLDFGTLSIRELAQNRRWNLWPRQHCRRHRWISFRKEYDVLIDGRDLRVNPGALHDHGPKKPGNGLANRRACDIPLVMLLDLPRCHEWLSNDGDGQPRACRYGPRADGVFALLRDEESGCPIAAVTASNTGRLRRARFRAARALLGCSVRPRYAQTLRQ